MQSFQQPSLGQEVPDLQVMSRAGGSRLRHSHGWLEGGRHTGGDKLHCTPPCTAIYTTLGRTAVHGNALHHTAGAVSGPCCRLSWWRPSWCSAAPTATGATQPLGEVHWLQWIVHSTQVLCNAVMQRSTGPVLRQGTSCQDVVLTTIFAEPVWCGMCSAVHCALCTALQYNAVCSECSAGPDPVPLLAGVSCCSAAPCSSSRQPGSATLGRWP